MLKQLTVFNAAEQIIAYLSNEQASTCPILSCRQHQTTLEGGAYADILTLSVPSTHPDAACVTQGALVGFTDPDGYFQLYRIVEPVREDSAANTITATCEHAFYELLGEALEDIRPTDDAAGDAGSQLLTGTRWEIGTADDLGANSVRVYYTSVLAGLVAVAQRWGGELRFRLSVTGGAIDHRYVDILTRRGAITGKRFEYGKDLIGIRYTPNIQNLATALYGHGKGVEIPTDDPNSVAYGRRLSFADVVWSVANGDPCDKPAGQEWVGDDAAMAAWGSAGGTRHIFGFATFDDETDAATLLQRTWDELQIRKNPQTTYELSVIQLEGIAGLEHEAVRLGDTVNVINSSVSPAITGTARVVDIDRNLLDLSDAMVTLGNYIPTVTSTLASMLQAQQSMQDRQGSWDRAGQAVIPPPSGSALTYALDLLRTQLYSTISGVSTDQNGNILIENPDKTKALKLGAGILAAANTKSGGEYVWTTYATGDGVTATAVMAAVGTFLHLTAGEPDSHRLEFGTGAYNEPYARMYDSDGVLASEWIKNAFKMGESSIQKWTTPGGHRKGIAIFPV